MYKFISKAVLFFVLSIFLASASYADDTSSSQPNPTPSDEHFFDGLNNIGKTLSNKLNNNLPSDLETAGLGYAAKLVTPALAIGGGLALSFLFVQVVQYFGGNVSGSILNIIFDIAVPSTFAGYLINNYQTLIHKADPLLQVVSSLGGNSTGAMLNYYSSILSMLGTSVDKSVSNITSGGFTAGLGHMIDALVVCLFVLFILLLLIQGIGGMVGLILMGPFLYAVGIAFGPVLIAGIVTPWTRDYFKTWVGYLFATAMLTGVVGVVLGIASTVIGDLAFSNFTDTSTTPVALNMAVAAILIMAVQSLISQAPSIAAALVPGSLGANAVGTFSPSRMASHAKMVSGAGNAVGESARNAGSKGASLARQAYAKTQKPMDFGLKL